MKPPDLVRLTPGKRVLFLTKDPELIRRQLAGELDLRMEDLAVDDLLDDINTDAMTPGLGLLRLPPGGHRAQRLRRPHRRRRAPVPERTRCTTATSRSSSRGYRKGVGSSRETAVQAEKWSGIRIAIAASFAPIHARNNINQGVLMGDHAHAPRGCRRGEAIPLDEFTRGCDPITRHRSSSTAASSPSRKALARGEVDAAAAGHRPRGR